MTPPLSDAALALQFKALEDADAVARLWRRDASLWKSEPEHRKLISGALGWLDLPRSMASEVAGLAAFADEVRGEGFAHAVVLGMGGSSLAPEVFRRAFGTRPGYPRLLVLDSTDPEAIRDTEAAADPRKTLYIVSSKSGTTTEPLRLFDYFQAKVLKSGGSTRAQFVAVTDPGTPLALLAEKEGFRRVFLNPADVGGRFSALSFFGLVPAALAGADIAELLKRARGAMDSCAAGVPVRDNPGASLGAALAALAAAGRDKLTFLACAEFESAGLWLEQLLAESTGKEGRGVIPISEKPFTEPRSYGKDRVFVVIQNGASADAALEAHAANLERAGHPVLRVPLDGPLDLGAQFYLWEIAVAILGLRLGIDPFDQPNVQAAKTMTTRILDGLGKGAAAAAFEAHAEGEGYTLSFSKAAREALSSEGVSSSAGTALLRLLARREEGGYLALLPYLAPGGDYAASIDGLRAALSRGGAAPVQMGYGPRYLHSTGQLHKGGPGGGLFLILTRRDREPLAIPGASYDFAQLISAQAAGDFQALDAEGRRAVFVQFQGDADRALRAVAAAITDAEAPLRLR